MKYIYKKENCTQLYILTNLLKNSILLMFLFPIITNAQLTPEEISKIDSLKNRIETSNNPSTVVKSIVAWSNIIYVSDPSLDADLMRKMDSVCDVNLKKKNDELFFLNAKGIALNNLGNFYLDRGNYLTTLKYYKESFTIDEKINKSIENNKRIAISLNNIGVVYSKLGDFAKAIVYYRKGLKIQEEIGDNVGASMSFTNIGIIYQNLDEFDKALEYYNKSLNLHEKQGDKFGIAGCLFNIGEIHRIQGDMVSSKKYLEQCKGISKEVGDRLGVANSLHSMGMIFQHQGDFELALKYYSESLSIKEEIEDDSGISQVLLDIGQVYNSQGLYGKSLLNSKQALDLSLKIGTVSTTNKAYLALSSVYKKMGRYQEGLEMYEEYVLTKEILESDKNQREIYRQEYKYEYEKQAYSDSLDAVQKNQITQLKLQKQQTSLTQRRTINYLLTGAILILVIWLLTMAYQKNQVNKQRKIIAIQNDEREKIIQEIHHRVKNNLQIVKSLLSLQQCRVKDTETINILQNCQGRLITMAGIHERIYKLGEYKEIKVQDYFTDLINHIVESNQLDHNVELEFKISDLTMSPDVVIYIALIVNEIVTNSCKHAFNRRGSPKIGFELQETEPGLFNMTIYDNGIGKGETQAPNDSLGWELIEVFSEQLNGKMKTSFENGTEYKLTFSI